MTKKKTYSRTTYLIKNSLHTQLLRANTLLAIFVCLAVIQLSTDILGNYLDEIYPPNLLAPVYKNLQVSFVIRVLLILGLAVLAALFIAHRIAGPVYNIERNMNSISNGDFTKQIQLRKSDELKSIAEGINKISGSIGHSLDTVEKKLKNLEELLGNLCNSEPEPDRRLKLCEEANTSLKEAKSAISCFNIRR